MQPSLVFLGSAGGHKARNRQLRASGGILVQTEGLQFVIDPGPGCLVKAREVGANLKGTSAVLLTHIHTGHSNDFNAVIEAMTDNGEDQKGVAIINEDIKDLSHYHLKMPAKVIEMRPGKKLAINQVEITATNAFHDVSCIGFKIMSKDFTLSYVSDTKYSRKLVEEHSGVDILICNCKNPIGERDKYNMNSDDVIKLAEKVKPKLLIITHFGMSMLKKDPLFEARDIQRKLRIQTIAAKDGMIINPSSHAAKTRQRTLYVFGDKEKADEGKDEDNVDESAINKEEEE